MKLIFNAKELNFFNAKNANGGDIRIRKGAVLSIGEEAGRELMENYPGEFSIQESQSLPPKPEAAELDKDPVKKGRKKKSA